MHDNKERKILADRFAEYGSAPAEDSWAAIEKGLDREKSLFTFFRWGLNLIAIVTFSLGIFNSLYNESQLNDGLINSAKSGQSAQLNNSNKNNSRNNNNDNTTNENSTNSNGVRSNENTVGHDANENQSQNVAANSGPNEINNDGNTILINKGTANDKKVVNQDHTVVDNKEHIENTVVDSDKKTETDIAVVNIDTDDSEDQSLVISDTKNETNIEVASEIAEDSQEQQEQMFAVGNIKRQELKLLPDNSNARELNTSGKYKELQKPYPPKWEFDLRASTFFNVGTPRAKGYVDSYSWAPVSSSAPADYAQNYERYGEIQTTFSRRLGMRFRVAIGLSTSFSRNEGFASNGIDRFALSQLTFGIPVEVAFTAFQFRRFSVTPSLGILNEFNNHLNTLTTTVGYEPNGDPIEEVGRLIDNGYSFGLQPSLELSLYTSENTTLYISGGYRRFLYNKSNGKAPGILQPNYIQTAIGLRWIIR